MTGRLGTSNSVLGQIVLGTDSVGADPLQPVASSAISLTSEASVFQARQEISSDIAVTDEASTTSTFERSASSLALPLQTATSANLPRQSPSSTLSLTSVASCNRVRAEAESTIELTDAARVPESYEADGSSTISPTQSAAATSLRVEASSTLELDSIADEGVKVRSASSTLSLTNEASSERILTCQNTLTLTQEAIQGVISASAQSFLWLTLAQSARSVLIAVEASSLLGLSSEAESNIRMQIVDDELTLTDEATNIGPRYAEAESELTELGEETFDPDTLEFTQETTGLSHEATPTLIAVQSIESIISFAQWANGGRVRADAIAADAESVLSPTSTAYRNITPEAESQLSLTSGVEGHSAKPASSELDSLDVEATVIVVRGNLTGSNTLVVSHACAYVLEAGNTHCLYSPFVGASSDPNAPTPPPATYTAAGATTGFRLQYPATGVVTDELILRAPNLGNIDRLSMQRINRETRGGTLIVYADPIWPKVETLVLQFSGLSSAEAQSLLAFMEDHLGEEIKLVDWEDREWAGVISNPQDPIVQDRKGCQFTASFEFEGTKV